MGLPRGYKMRDAQEGVGATIREVKTLPPGLSSLIRTMWFFRRKKSSFRVEGAVDPGAPASMEAPKTRGGTGVVPRGNVSPLTCYPGA